MAKAQFTRLNNPNQTLSIQTVEAIVSRIENGELKAGEKLPSERILLQQMGISRSVLREGMRMLEANGLVESHVGRGRFVTGRPDSSRSQSLVSYWLLVHREDIEHLNEIRQTLEVTALSHVRKKDLPSLCDLLEQIIDQQDLAARSKHTQRSVDLDTEFHKTLCSFTENIPLKTLIFSLIDSAKPTVGKVYAIPKAAKHSILQHRRIVGFLKKSNKQAALDQLHNHHGTAFVVALGE